MFVKKRDNMYVCIPEHGNGHDASLERAFLRHLVGLDDISRISFPKVSKYKRIKRWLRKKCTLKTGGRKK